MAFQAALRADELWIGEMVGVDVGGRRVLLVNVDGEVRAYEDRCQHRAMPLSQGRFVDGRLVCRAHEWTYDACTGRGVNPASACLRRFVVEVADGEIRVDVDVA